MKASRRALLLTAVVAASLSICGVANAAIVTVGPELTGAYTTASCDTGCTLTNTSVPQSGGNVVSPISGVIVRWHVVGGTTPGTYRLREISPLGFPTFQFVASSTPESSNPTAGIQTFSTNLPISAGQGIAVDMSATASIGLAPFGSFVQWEPVPGEGPSPAPFNQAGEDVIGFNAEMQPAPTITSLGTTTGSTTGGTSVTISGTDFEGASAVSFGAVPATSFVVNSESQVVAVSPPGSGAAPISVTTIAGKATSSQSFTYETPAPKCVVPKLKGKKVSAAKKALITAHCKLGTVKKLKGATSKNGKVSKQSRSPKSTAKGGSKVNVTLKP